MWEKSYSVSSNEWIGNNHLEIEKKMVFPNLSIDIMAVGKGYINYIK